MNPDNLHSRGGTSSRRRRPRRQASSSSMAASSAAVSSVDSASSAASSSSALSSAPSSAPSPPASASSGGGGGGGGRAGGGRFFSWLEGWGGFGSGNGRRQKRGLGELVGGGDGWRPTRTRFSEVRWPEGELEMRWPEEEFDGEWFEVAYTDLLVRVGEFVWRYFGYGDLPVRVGGEEKGLVWLEGGFSDKFMWFVAQVAMQDNNRGGWDVLLVERKLRQFLVMGVIAKVLETNVFDDLLFGADKVQKDMLVAQDKCTIEHEGYQRTKLRSQCVRTILAGAILTPEFWPCVDQLTLQLTELLLPLVRLMDKHFPASKATSLRSFYQDLHAVVAGAGYLSIGTRWSRNIFCFSLPPPGEVWDTIDQQSVDTDIYKASEAAGKAADMDAEAKWRAECSRRQQWREARSTPQTFRARGEAIAASALTQLKAARRRVMGRGNEEKEEADNKSSVQDVWRRQSRIGKVQIILWPLLQRFATVGQIDPETGAASGENITTVLKSHVAYYSGGYDESGEESDHYPTLDDWVRENKRERMWNSLLQGRWAAYAAGAWLLLSFLARYSPVASDVLLILQYGLLGVVQYVVREAVLFVLEVLVTVIAVVIGIVKVMMFLAYAVRNLLGGWLGSGLRLLWGAFGKGGGWVEGFGKWHDSPLPYPSLTWGSIKGLARAFAGDVIWKPFTVRVPVGYMRNP